MASSKDTEERLKLALADRYRIKREIGSGGMATVYLAEDLKHDRKVAVKVLEPELAALIGAERFLAEIKTTANLQHPHIVPLFDSGEADGFVFYVMPFVEGESLRARIDREKQLPVDEAVRIATYLAEALDYAHRHGVIHRDIKPANVLIHDGQPMISDFGIALAVGAAGADRLTETGLSLGTPHYMSPEQATGDQPAGPATDTYALGCVLYETLVGEPPYTGSTAQAVLGKIIAGKPESVTSHRRSVPANVDASIRKALEKLPADRFTTAQEFAEALADPHFRHDDPVTLAGATPPSGIRPRGWFFPSALAVGILVVGFGLGSLWHASRGTPAPNDTPVVVLMDTSAPRGVYDEDTRDNSGTNADVLSEVLRELPVVLHKEAVGSTWAREDQILRQRPDLIIIHRSAFFHSMNLELGFGYPDDPTRFDERRAPRLYEYADNKLMAFFGFVGQGNPNTAFLVYSRGNPGGWVEDQFRADWVAQLEGRFPALEGRVETMHVPGGQEAATFRDPETAQTLRRRVRAILGIETEG